MLRTGLFVTAAVLVAASAGGFQDGPSARDDFRPRTLRASERAIVGIAAYPDELIAAIVRISSDPVLAATLANAAIDGRDVNAAVAEAPMEMRDAVRRLSAYPELLAIVGSSPNRLRELRDAFAVSPEGARQAIERARIMARDSESRAIAAWSTLLREQPSLRTAYRDALDRYCAAQIRENPAFACAIVEDASYYDCVAPTRELRDFDAARGGPEHLSDAIDAWLSRFGEAAQFAAAADSGDAPHATLRRYSGGERGVGLVPVIMQPGVDQPPAARLVRAFDAHARAWATDAANVREPTVARRPTSRAEAEPPPRVVYLDREPNVPLASDDSGTVVVRENPGYEVYEGPTYAALATNGYPYASYGVFRYGYGYSGYDSRCNYGWPTYNCPPWSYDAFCDDPCDRIRTPRGGLRISGGIRIGGSDRRPTIVLDRRADDCRDDRPRSFGDFFPRSDDGRRVGQPPSAGTRSTNGLRYDTPKMQRTLRSDSGAARIAPSRSDPSPRSAAPSRSNSPGRSLSPARAPGAPRTAAPSTNSASQRVAAQSRGGGSSGSADRAAAMRGSQMSQSRAAQASRTPTVQRQAAANNGKRRSQ